MAGTKVIRKFFEAFRGLDKRSSDLTRDINSATVLKNAQFLLRRSLSLSKRSGSKIVGHSTGPVLGIEQYVYGDRTTGETREELLGLSDNLYRVKESTFAVNYTGAGTSVLFSLLLDSTTSTFHAIIEDTSVVVLDKDLGTGLEASPITLANLKTDIDALADFSATITGTTTLPAAILPLTTGLDVSGASTNITFFEWELVNTVATNPFSTYNSNSGNIDFRNASLINMLDIVYIGTGYEEMHKYDGQTVYRAGMPKGAIPTMAAAAGALTGSFKYKISYEQKDNRGNIVEGVISDLSATVSPAAQSVNVTITNILAASGFNTHVATVNGNQTGVTTITVNNSPHTFKAGDTAYFLDRSSSTYVERAISSVTATTIVIAGAVVNVNAADVISNNLKINVWRTTDLALNPGSEYYLVATIPNNSLASTQVYNDVLTDALLLAKAKFLEPIKLPELPPKGRYLTAHEGGLCVAGNFTNPNTVYYSDIHPEYFPVATNSFDVVHGFGPLTAMGSSQHILFVFKENAVIAVSGNLFEDAFKVDVLAEGQVGCLAHHSIVNINELLIFLSPIGFYSVGGSSALAPIGDPVSSEFDVLTTNTDLLLTTKRATAINDKTNDRYLCFVPAETLVGSVRYPNANSKVFAYDYKNQSWFEWDGINAGGEFAFFEDNFYWVDKRESAGSLIGNLRKRHSTLTQYDYADNHLAIAWEYGTQWESLGEPSVFKKALRLKLYSLHPELAGAFTLNMVAEKNYLTGSSHTSDSIVFGQAGVSSGYGISPYGSSIYGSPADTDKLVKLKSEKFQSLRFLYTNSTLHENVILTGTELEIVAPFPLEVRE